MGIENLSIKGVPENQVKLLKEHLKKADLFVFAPDPGLEKAGDLLWKSLSDNLGATEAEKLFQIVLNNKPEAEVKYQEEGFDSCQSLRELAKIAGEAILLGGMTYEAELIGKTLAPAKLQQLIDSKLIIPEDSWPTLKGIAQKYGAKQDFLFPGVTPSSSETPSLETLTYQSLIGQPLTSVRTLTGVGGLRADREWNFVTDLVTFVKLKVIEDKRYYPGIGVFYFLMNDSNGLLRSPIILKHPFLWDTFTRLSKKIASQREIKHSGVSILCSAYLPPWYEFKEAIGGIVEENFDLGTAFHSPSYEFSSLKEVFESVRNGTQINKEHLLHIDALGNKVGHCWSFNSTIHLPWTSRLAGLSNDFIGRITNAKGDYCIRYGIGYQGKSLEIREYKYGSERDWPGGTGNNHSYVAKYFDRSDCFCGHHNSFYLFPRSELWKQIKEHGFTRAALEFLEKQHG